MVTIEFHTVIKDGVIQIPEKYRKNFKDKVHVILIAEESQSGKANLLAELLAHPLKIAGFKPLSREEIYARK